MEQTDLAPDLLDPVLMVTHILKRTQDDVISWEQVELSGNQPPEGITGNLMDAYRGIHKQTGVTLMLTTYQNPFEVAPGLRRFLDPNVRIDPNYRSYGGQEIPVLDIIGPEGTRLKRVIGLQAIRDLESVVRYKTADPALKDFISAMLVEPSAKRNQAA